MNSAFWIIAIIAAGIYLYFKQTAIQNQEKSVVGFQEGSNQKAAPSLDKTIGETKAICPYCETKLEKKPSRKKQCPHCENYIYKRTRPYDDAHIIIREDQIEDMEEQWAIANGSYDLFLKEKKREQKIKERLTKRYGHEPSDSDLEWRILNDQLIEFEQKGDWGFARNKRLEMAKHLKKHSKPNISLKMFCEICYIDSNGLEIQVVYLIT